MGKALLFGVALAIIAALLDGVLSQDSHQDACDALVTNAQWALHPDRVINSQGLGAGRVMDPTGLYLDGQYILYFHQHNSDGTSERITRAESLDGIHWEDFTDVLQPRGDKWDSSLTAPAVLYDQERFYLWYEAPNKNPSRVGLAVSGDGVHFKRLEKPVLAGGQANDWDGYGVNAPSVIKADRHFFLYYAGYRRPGRGKWARIGVAVSKDCIHWAKFRGNPILEPTATWEGERLQSPFAFRIDSWFSMSYTGLNMESKHLGIGLASSHDGTHWVKSERNPIWMASVYWAPNGAGGPLLVKKNQGYLLFFHGYMPGYSESSIGVVQMAFDYDL